MLKRIVWNRTALTSGCKQNTVLMVNWIVWNRSAYMCRSGFGFNMTYNGRYAIKPKLTKQNQAYNYTRK